MKNPGLPLKTKIGYGTAELSNSLTWTMFYVLFLFFLTDVVKMDPAFAGFIMMIGTIWDAFSSPLVGIVSDRAKSKWGRRRPFILGVALPFGLITWLLFSDFGLSPVMTKAYFIAVVICTFTVFSLLDIPYTSLAAEMTQDYDERTSLISYRAVFSQIASIIGAALPFVLVEQLTKTFGSARPAWSVMTAAIGLFTVFPILITWRATRGTELYPEKTKISVGDIKDAVFKNRTFRFTVGVYTFSNVGLAIAGVVMVYFMQYYMGFNETQKSIAFLFLFACTILWIPLINYLSARFSKRWAFIIFIGLWALVQSIGAMLVRPGNIIYFYILTILASGGLIGVTMAGWSMIPDVVEVDEYKTGQRREGLYYGIFSFSRKIAVALAVWLVGILLSKIGYAPNAIQSSETLLGIRLIYAECVALFLFLSILMAYLLPMTRKRHEALIEAIRLKRQGGYVDEEKIKKLL
jgi:glycoside/pentoside/hexuronide:cation symporter, GPH family